MSDTLRSALSDRYELLRELGAGGMATVYLARDVRHAREVAIKVLHPELAAVLGAERFLSEIRTTASLQHPHILPLFDSGEAAGQLFYVMPFVDGETLRSRLEREKQLPIADAVLLAREVAGALQYAHERGVIHRDIKPENILLQGAPGDQHALVADFGIALAVTNAGGSRMTQTGLSLGTPQYMAPEQAMGERAIDARADIYALGAVTYEMLAGEPPFVGPNSQSIVARVLTERPRALLDVRDRVPAHVADAVEAALAKLPADRPATAAQFANALREESTRGRASAPRPSPRTRWRDVRLIGMAIVTAASLAVAAWSLRRPVPTEGPVLRVTIAMPDSLVDATTSQTTGHLAIAPDGSRLAMVARAAGSLNSQVWLRERHAIEARPIPGVFNVRDPFFGPNGTRIGVLEPSSGTIRLMDLDGSAEVRLKWKGLGPASWGHDGFIYVSDTSARQGIARFPATGGAAAPVTRVDTTRREASHQAPQLLADGRGVVFSVVYGSTTDMSTRDIAVASLDAGTPHRVLTRGVAAWVPVPGILIVLRADGHLVAMPFDAQTRTIGRPEVEVATDVWHGVTVATWDLALSTTGTLVYRAGSKGPNLSELVWLSRDGAVTVADTGWRADFVSMRLSPDGRRVVAEVYESSAAGLWIGSLTDGARSKLTRDDMRPQRPIWTPDGQRVAYINASVAPWSVVSQRADGSDAPRVEVQDTTDVSSVLATGDGSAWIYRTSSSAVSRGNIRLLRVGERVARPLVETPADERHPALSPDGRWLAYRSDESGSSEVYVRPFPNVADARITISTGGGSDPVWSRDGRELFYIDGRERLVSAEMQLAGGALQVQRRRDLFTVPADIVGNIAIARYDVAPDGRRFLMARRRSALSPGDAGRQYTYVLNWLDEVRARLAAAKAAGAGAQR
ncbi:MAG: protein kinase [Gemmatimonadaceae bacterium]|nr:protein kinase [Gemmatimonadaceae bacterium]